MESTSVERMLQAMRLAAVTGRTMRAATSRIPTTRIERATVTAASAATIDVQRPDGNARDSRAFFVEDDSDEWPVEKPDDSETDGAEHRDQYEVRTGDGEDRAEEVLKEVGVQCAGGRDQDDAERDSRIENESERLVARGAAARAEELDRHATDDRERRAR